MGSKPQITNEPSEELLRAWFAPVLRQGTRWCARNLQTECAFLKVENWEFPLTINDAEWDNSWICSPYTHYVSYAREEVRRAMPTAIGVPFSLLLLGLGTWFRAAQLNQVIMVNNWLMSTNPWPPWEGASLREALVAMRQRWPGHAVIFRSLNERESAPLLRALKDAGARIIPSRQIWYYDGDSALVLASRDFRKDVNLLRRGDLQRVVHEQLCDADFSRIAELYAQLYIDKYSRCNPCYTVEWLRYLWKGRHLQFTALRDNAGVIVGVEACGLIHGVMVSPVVGYDINRPRSMALYRRLAAVPVLSARERGVPLNLSAGVGRFKALRGGEPVMEFIAVIDAHLPLKRRLPWSVIEGLSRGVLEPVVRRMKL